MTIIFLCILSRLSLNLGDIMNILQLDMFKSIEECEIDDLRKAIKDMKSSQEKVRKKLFAENGKLTKNIMDLNSRLEILERHICNPAIQSQS